MKFRIRRVSYSPYLDGVEQQPCANAFQEGDEWYIEIADLPELMALSAEVEQPLIIEGPTILGGQYIKIYDDYNE